MFPGVMSSEDETLVPKGAMGNPILRPPCFNFDGVGYGRQGVDYWTVLLKETG